MTAKPMKTLELKSRGLFYIIIHQIFLLARDWPKRVTWPNIPQLKWGDIRDYNPPIDFQVILLATLCHVV